MKNLTIENNKSPNFIGSWNLEDNDMCENIIKFFDENISLQQKGITDSGVNEKIKKTIDITINPDSLKEPKYFLFNEYFKKLNECFIDYKEEYKFIKTFLKKAHIGHFNIQKYSPGDHFSRLHSERTGISNLHRIFAWMTYLNDVQDGGTTDFDYYGISVKPETGKTLIWPAEWTHAHTGSILNSGSKYIITGWIHFAE
jgi:hypothetical protein|tara:strand:+ start:157 stop:753 length:597 start_codon:yes stop_codon:yes gene_type:complete